MRDNRDYMVEFWQTQCLNKAKAICKNLFWKDLHSSLIICRPNILQDFPEEYKLIPINGEPHITENKVSVMQSRFRFKNLGELLEVNGNFRKLSEISGDKKQLSFEFDELKRTLTDFVEIYIGGRLVANSRWSARSNEHGKRYNIYGRLITKKKKG